MDEKARWDLSVDEKNGYIDALTEELPILRAKANISQEDLARIIGISRQKYGWIERKERRMSWNTYLSLIFFFDYNQVTHKMIRATNAFPSELIAKINKSGVFLDLEKVVGLSMEGLADVLDEQAFHAIKTLIMVEYARCSNLPGEAVVKSFDGKEFINVITDREIALKKAQRRIKGSSRSKE